MRPWLVSIMLAAGELQRLGLDPQLGIDLHFLKRAKEAGKGVLELESLEFQLELLSGFSPELQEQFLSYQIEQNDDIATVIDEMLAAWNVGDTKAIHALIHDYEKDDPSLKPAMKAFFDDRNVGMASKIVDYLKDPENTYFVVIGAGHLVGKQGVVELLRKAGDYKIEQMEATAKAAAAP